MDRSRRRKAAPVAESLDTLVLSMSTALQAAESTMRDINDWGEPSGFCQEFDRLYQDADQQLRSLRSRAMHLLETMTPPQPKTFRAASWPRERFYLSGDQRRSAGIAPHSWESDEPVADAVRERWRIHKQTHCKLPDLSHLRRPCRRGAHDATHQRAGCCLPGVRPTDLR